jgi:hypothetical protein
VSQLRKRHTLAIDLLQQLGLDNIKLEAKEDGRYRYYAWSPILVAGNGAPRSHRGVVQKRNR